MSEITGNIPAYFEDLSNTVRDLGNEFEVLQKQTPGLLALIESIDRGLLGSDTKMEWLEDIDDFENDVLNNSAPVLAADTSFVVTNINRFAVNMIIKFQGYGETMRVTGIDTGSSTVSVVRNANGLALTPTTVADETTIDIINRPVVEYSRSHEVGSFEPTIQYNLPEVFREDIPFTERVAIAKQYGFDDPEKFINYNVMKWMKRIITRLSRSIVWGERSLGTSTTPGTMRGVFTWLSQDGTNLVDASGAALSSGILNAILEEGYKRDPSGTNLVLYMNTIQARTMATFNTYVANRMETVGFDSNVASGATFKTVFKGDLEATGMPTIVVDNDAPRGTVMLLETNKIQVMYPKGGRMVEWDSKLPDLPPIAQRRSLIMMASLKMQDHKDSHAMIHNLKKTL